MKKLIYITVLSAFVSTVAYAHAELSSSMPADKAVLESAPQQIMLHFSEPVRLTAVSVEGTDAEKHDLGPLSSAMSANFSLAVPVLSPGNYVVSWRALSGDTHVMRGEFAFRVQPGVSQGQTPQQSAAPEQHEQHSQPH